MSSKRSQSALAGKLAVFVQQYKRKAHKGWDPNDRRYDRDIEDMMKRMKPEELSDLLAEGADEEQGDRYDVN